MGRHWIGILAIRKCRSSFLWSPTPCVNLNHWTLTSQCLVISLDVGQSLTLHREKNVPPSLITSESHMSRNDLEGFQTSVWTCARMCCVVFARVARTSHPSWAGEPQPPGSILHGPIRGKHPPVFGHWPLMRVLRPPNPTHIFQRCMKSILMPNRQSDGLIESCFIGSGYIWLWVIPLANFVNGRFF